MNTTKTVTVTRRTRNLGFGSTSQPVRGPNGRLAIDSVDAPDVTGTAREVMAARDQAVRANSGHDWRGSFFVGGCRVVSDDAVTDLSMLLAPDGYRVDSVTLAVEVGE